MSVPICALFTNMFKCAKSFINFHDLKKLEFLTIIPAVIFFAIDFCCCFIIYISCITQ